MNTNDPAGKDASACVWSDSAAKVRERDILISVCDSLMDVKATGDFMKHTVTLSGFLRFEQSLETFWIM